MGNHVADAERRLILRYAQRQFGIDNRHSRVEALGDDKRFNCCLFIGDNRSTVHFRTGGRRCWYSDDGEGASREPPVTLTVGNHLPWVTFVVDGCRYYFGCVHGTAATHADDDVATFIAGDLGTSHHRR